MYILDALDQNTAHVKYNYRYLPSFWTKYLLSIMSRLQKTFTTLSEDA